MRRCGGETTTFDRYTLAMCSSGIIHQRSAHPVHGALRSKGAVSCSCFHPHLKRSLDGAFFLPQSALVTVCRMKDMMSNGTAPSPTSACIL